jgi:hypothetical protein
MSPGHGIHPIAIRGSRPGWKAVPWIARPTSAGTIPHGAHGLRPVIRMAHREFTDAAGVLWAVWDVQPSISTDGVSAPGILLGEDAAQGWLAFQSPTERRRFYMPPANWETFTDAQLAKLLHHAVRAGPTR